MNLKLIHLINNKMGIKGLPAYIRKQCDGVYVEISADEFKNRFIAVDANAYAHRYAAGSQTIQQYLVKFINLIISLKSVGIYPVFIFDGGAPQEKWEEQQKRKETQESIRAEISLLEQEDDDYGTNQDRIASLSKRLTHTPPEYKIALNELLTACGILVIVAPDEAERMCAALAIEKKVALVLSPDSDLWVYKIDIVASDYDIYRKNFTIVSPSNIIKAVGLTHTQWLDFCIMCGCDYNHNIPGIGPAKSMDLIKKFKNIENLNESYDTSCLKYERCRELFRYQPTEINKLTKSKLHPELKKVLDKWGVGEYHQKILRAVSHSNPTKQIKFT